MIVLDLNQSKKNDVTQKEEKKKTITTISGKIRQEWKENLINYWMNN
jgi:hypothetical protein